MSAALKTGILNVDHIAIPVRDLDLNQDFYLNTLGLKFKTTRRNPDGSPRQTYVLAGENIIGLHLPGITAGASSSTGPRIGVNVSPEHFAQAQQALSARAYAFSGPVEHAPEMSFERSIFFDDPDGNHLELCIRRDFPPKPCISHTLFETRDMKIAIAFYMAALGAGGSIVCGGETFIPAKNGQMVGLVEVKELSERSKKHGRGCHMAMDVTQEDFDVMLSLIEQYGGKNQGDNRADDGLRPEGERSVYFFDPDNNRLQITAHAPNRPEELMSDEEKWRRIIDSRRQQGRGLSRWESGGKKFL